MFSNYRGDLNNNFFDELGLIIFVIILLLSNYSLIVFSELSYEIFSVWVFDVDLARS